LTRLVSAVLALQEVGSHSASTSSAEIAFRSRWTSLRPDHRVIVSAEVSIARSPGWS